MRKKLVLVGNLIDDIDRASFIDSFDYVVRVNRMNNFGQTGTKTDLLLVDTHGSFWRLVDLDKYKDIVNTYVRKILVNEQNIGVNPEGMKYIFPDKLMEDRLKIFNVAAYATELDSRFSMSASRPTNTFSMLYWLITHGFSENYDIYISNENPLRFINTPTTSHGRAALTTAEWYIRFEQMGLIRFI